MNLVSKEGSTLEEEQEVVQPYESMQVEELSATTYYDSESKNYFDVVNNQVMLICLNNGKYVVRESTYSEETKTYTIVLSAETKYTITIDENGVATFTKVEVETE